MKRFFTWFMVFSLFFGQVRADEGMWLLNMLNKTYDDMKKQGLKLSPEDIYNLNKPSLKDAVVNFGGFCTGEIISDKGLILTNHHCGYGRIQAHSSVDHDYLKDGFWAKSFDDELANPGLFVKFFVRIEDVTKKVTKKLTDDMTEAERAEAMKKIKQRLIDKAKKGNNYDVNIRSFFGGNNYYMLVYEKFSDIRLVGAPPESIGKFGHDTDNWMWPRHTGDFSIFRVYANKNNEAADFSPDNVPYKPKHFFPISLKGKEEKDFAMVIGYPGGTQRYMTSYEVNEELVITHPNRIKIRGLRQALMMEDMKASDKVRIQYSSKFSRSSNYWKFSIGQKKGLEDLNILAKKQKIEGQFVQWVKEDKKRTEKYGKALNLIENATKKRGTYKYAMQYLAETMLRGIELIGTPRHASKLLAALEDEKTKKEDLEAQIRKLKGMAAGFYKDYNAPTDKKIAKALLKLYRSDVDEEFRPSLFKTIDSEYKGDIDAYVNDMFATSIFASEEKLMKFLESPDAEILKNDLAYKASVAAIDLYLELRGKSAGFNDDFKKGHRLFIAGLIAMNKDKVYYPDANFTMRLTYGTVGGYKAKDAVRYDFVTTLKGVMEKAVPGDFEFDVSPKLKELYENKDYGQYGEGDKMVVCFTTNNDITGGNSGSPVLNGKGELIGTAFDGNWEAMSGDIAFETELQKCINVDIRYVLFVIDKYAGAKRLIDEMKLMK